MRGGGNPISPELYITGLVAAIGSLASVIAVLYKSVLGAKDQIIATKDAQIAYREQLIAAKDAQILALQIALQGKDEKLYQSLDTLGDAVKLVEQGAAIPPQTQTRRTGTGR